MIKAGPLRDAAGAEQALRRARQGLVLNTAVAAAAAWGALVSPLMQAPNADEHSGSRALERQVFTPG